MNKSIRNSILVIIFGIILLLFSFSLFRMILGGFGFLVGLCLVFFGIIYLIISIVHKD
jgi:ABC-type Fe3+-siderophore transport system permease subunit